MHQPALISVIVPTLNEGKQMGGLLDFLLAQPGVEVIVSDGGSRDETVSICRHYPVKVVEGRPGRGGQLNAGAAQASGKVLFFLHADSRPRVEVFDQMRQAIEKGRRWGCCSLRFDREAAFYRMVARGSNWRAQRGICYGDQGIFCQREWFMNQGGFPDLIFLEDLAFSRRVRIMNRPWVITAEIITSTRRFEQEGRVSTLLRMQVVKMLFGMGIHPLYLARYYDRGRKKNRCVPQSF